MSLTFGSATIQSLTFTEKQLGSGVTITYKGGVALSVSVVGQAITVTIIDGTTTNLQIANAILANTDSLALVTAAVVSGHNADTPHTCVKVPLAGGVTAAVKATLVMGPALFTAAVAGTAGNSTTLQLEGNVSFTITTVTDATHLVVGSSTGLIVGATITQGANVTTITTITDATHIIVASTTGFTAAAAVSSVVAGSEKVLVTSSAILVQIQNGVSTWTQLAAAIAASGPAAALVVMTSSGKSLAQAITVAFSGLTAAVNLAGGLAAAPATVTNQLVVVTSKTNNAAQNGLTLSFTDGATAGAEVVTVDGSGNVNVQIQSGTSTVTQIVTALNAATGFSALYTASGTSATTPLTVNGKTLTGQVGPSSLQDAYQDQAGLVLTTTYQAVLLKGNMCSLTIWNDEAAGSLKNVIFSFDGVNQHGLLKATQIINQYGVNQSAIFLKCDGGGAPAYHLTAAGI